jgi:hypothetical protein
VEATGVELITVLIARKLLIPGTATPAKKAPLPDPLYVYCTKMLFALESNRHHIAATVSHRFSEMDRKSTSLPAIPRVTLSISSVRRLTVSITSGLPVTRPECVSNRPLSL